MRKALQFYTATIKSPLFLPFYCLVSRKILTRASENTGSASLLFPVQNQYKTPDTETPLQIDSVSENCGQQGWLEISKTTRAQAERKLTPLELTTSMPDPPPLGGPDPSRGPEFPGPPLPSPPFPDVPMKTPRNPPPKPPSPADKVPPPMEPPQRRPPVPPDI